MCKEVVLMGQKDASMRMVLKNVLVRKLMALLGYELPGTRISVSLGDKIQLRLMHSYAIHCFQQLEAMIRKCKAVTMCVVGLSVGTPLLKILLLFAFGQL